jgi:hypothetical protein
MKDIYQVSPGELAAWIIPRANWELPLDWIAFYAVRGMVEVLDAGNGFDVKRVMRRLRHRTEQVTEALSRIHASRAATCYQLIRLLEETPASTVPCIVLDFLAMFDDESIPVVESYHLLGIAIGHLHRLRKYAPVVIGLHPSRIHLPERSRLADMVLENVDDIITGDTPRPNSPTRL